MPPRKAKSSPCPTVVASAIHDERRAAPQNHCDPRSLPSLPRSNHSYFQSGSSGCFKSQSGRRLRTIGSSSKLYAGGGDVVAHSSVQAFHGSGPAGLPFLSDQKILTTKIAKLGTWIAAPMVDIWFQ